MVSEREKMHAGELFNSLDCELRQLREHARLVCAKYNAHPSRGNLKHVTRLFADNQGVFIEPGFQCDYGVNIHVGEGSYMNFNCVLLDSASIHIGKHVLFGPGVHVYTVSHPKDWQSRMTAQCTAKPVLIGDHAWVGGGAKIFPGVQIGERAIIAANAVVRENVLAGQVFKG